MNCNMIPYDYRDEHNEAFRQWRKAIWAAQTFPHLNDFFRHQAEFWQMQYETLRAQLVCDYARKIKEDSNG